MATGNRYTIGDVGCYAEGALGQEHVRAVLARMLSLIKGTEKLQKELSGAGSDDCSEEDDAIDILNAKLCEPDVHFTMTDGDLVLTGYED